MKKGVVDPSVPTDRWDTPPREDVKDLLETEWFLWIAKIMDKIEDEGRLEEFKTEGTNSNPYREAILDDVCEQAFGSKHPTKEGVFLSHGMTVARMFARGTQGRADYSRSLKAEAHELLEQHGPKLLSSQQMGTLRATSVKKKEGCKRQS